MSTSSGNAAPIFGEPGRVLVEGLEAMNRATRDLRESLFLLSEVGGVLQRALRKGDAPKANAMIRELSDALALNGQRLSEFGTAYGKVGEAMLAAMRASGEN